VKILNRPATVSPNATFWQNMPLKKTESRGDPCGRLQKENFSGRPPKTGISQETCQRKTQIINPFEEKSVVSL